MVCSIWLNPQMFVCTLFKICKYKLFFPMRFWKCQIIWITFLPTGPVWKLPAMRDGHSKPTHLCSDLCLSFDLWSTAKQTLMMVAAHWDSLRHEHTTLKKQDSLPPLFGILSLPIKIYSIYLVHWLDDIKIHNSPSGPVCLKAAMP